MPANLKTAARRQYILSLIPETGINVAGIAKLLKVAHRSAQDRLHEYMKAGLVFVARVRVDGAPSSEAWYFTDRGECLAFREYWAERAELRRREHDRRGLEKMRQDGISGKRKKSRAKPKNPLAFATKGTRVAAAAKQAGPARMAGEPDMSGAHVVKATHGPERFAPDPQDKSWRLFSSMKPGQYLEAA